MRIVGAIAAIFIAALTSAPGALAQTTPPPLPVPDKMPFDIPYGSPISLEMAKHAADAVVAESIKRGWKEIVAVVGPAGDLVYFERMDNAQLASITIAQGKAWTAARFRRETQVFYNQFETGHGYVSTLSPQLVASPGGIPIVVDGHLIGAIGCSGATAGQDVVVCRAGIAAITH
jgi:glc operon protein GlcG